MSSIERPPWLVRAHDVAEHEGRYPPPWDGEITTLGRDLGRAAGSRGIGAWRERMPPGHRTAFTHAHSLEEELVYVLSGTPSVRWIDPGAEARELVLAPGDFAAFPPGTAIAHAFVNRSDADAELLVVGARDPADQVTYPEDPAFETWRKDHRAHRRWTDATGPTGEGRGLPYRIETPRLVLRPWRVVDAPLLLAAHQRNREHLRHMRWAAEVATVDDLVTRIQEWTQRMARGDDGIYVVVDPEGQFVGAGGMHDRVGPKATELGYWIDHTHEGKGYVTEWCAALTRVAFEVRKLERVDIWCADTNTRSAAVPERLGFRHEATLRGRIALPDGTLADTMIWTILPSEFAATESSRTPIKAWDAAGRRLL